MTQNQLYREVAQATGESVNFIRQRGFGIIIVPRRRSRPRRGGARGTVAKGAKSAVQLSKAA